MKKLFVIFVLAPSVSFCQRPKDPPVSQSVQGTIVMPVLMSVSVTSLDDQTISMRNMEEMSFGRLLPSFYKLKIKSNKPWSLVVRAENKNFSPSPMGSKDFPTSTLYLKESTAGNYTSLSNAPQAIIHSSNNKIENDYLIDLKIGSSLNYNGGNYFANLTFTVEPQ